MRKNVLALAMIGLTFIGCGVGKSEPNEDFTDLQGTDEKSDAFSKKMKLVGSLDYGQTSKPVKYTSSPKFRAFKFGGQPGDAVTIDVKSADGDAVAWLVDNSFKVIASNDDAAGTTDSHIAAKLPGNTNPAIITYYIIFRDYYLDAATFTVSLAGPAKDFYACQVDEDCVAVDSGGCCPHGYKTAVNVSSVDDYAKSAACTVTPRPICPLFIINDTRVAECNNTSHKCEMVAIDAIQCGGFIRNSHKCPAGDQCLLISNPDVPGRCVDPTQPIACGGIRGLQCGLGQICVDDPNGSCNVGLDPDCQGVCQTAPADCRTNGCATGSTCTRCKVGFSCLPNGAVC